MCKLICVLLLLTRVVFVSLQSCHYLFDLGTNYREFDDVDGDYNYTVINGCINDTVRVFQKMRGVHIWLTGGTLPTLEKNFVSNMNNVKEVDIDNFHVETIEPGAFSNVPQLEKISIHDNRIKTLSRGVFDVIPSLQDVQFFYNKLSHIEDNAFANLPNLKIISLNDNELDRVRREWFTNSPNIESFNMFHNFVRKIPFGMFHGWRNLKGIYFNSNSISVIEGPMFKDNPSFITSVGLHHNRLTSVSLDTFPDSFYYGFLGISANLLNYLPEEFLKKIRVGNFGIYGNPFSCSCWEKTRKILLDRDVTIDDPGATFSGFCKDEGVPVCGNPLNSSNTCVESVDSELTHRFLSYLKKINHDLVHDSSGQQCAMFDELDLVDARALLRTNVQIEEEFSLPDFRASKAVNRTYNSEHDPSILTSKHVNLAERTLRLPESSNPRTLLL